MLIENLAEIVPVAALVMGIIASIYAYRQAERQKASASTPGMVAIGGALASEGAAKIHAEEIQRLAQSINKLTEAQNATARATAENARRSKEYLDELEHIRRILADMAGLMRARH